MPITRSICGTEAIEIDGVVDALAALAPYVRMAIVTTSKRADFDLIHENRQIRQFMEFVLVREDYQRSKPDPEPYLTGLQRMGGTKAETLIVEDSARGLNSAVAAGIDCAVVHNDSLPELTGRTFDRIMFLQSFGYAKDPVRTLRTARSMLTDDGIILLTRSHPIRYAVERAEQNGTSLGEEYYSTAESSYSRRGWNDKIQLTHRPFTIADLLNVISAAGLWIETAVEPQLSEEAQHRYPHKQAWLNKHLGIIILKLRPRPL
jgi:hypothetical protein